MVAVTLYLLSSIPPAWTMNFCSHSEPGATFTLDWSFIIDHWSLLISNLHTLLSHHYPVRAHRVWCPSNIKQPSAPHVAWIARVWLPWRHVPPQLYKSRRSTGVESDVAPPTSHAASPTIWQLLPRDYHQPPTTQTTNNNTININHYSIYTPFTLGHDRITTWGRQKYGKNHHEIIHFLGGGD